MVSVYSQVLGGRRPILGGYERLIVEGGVGSERKIGSIKQKLVMKLIAQHDLYW